MFWTALALLQLVSTPGEPAEAFASRVTPEVLVVRAAGPSVVYVKTNVTTSGWDLFGRPVQGRRPLGSGSGVVLYEDGFIVTNNHVVQGAEEIEVHFDPTYDETVYPARLISAHPTEDLALLKIEGEGFAAVPLGRSDDLMIGERVLAIGNPYGHSHTVSAGIISGLHRDITTDGLQFENLIQTDASINPGNSGGPLLNIHGELIGINTVMNSAAENIGFAIPVDHLRQVLQEYLLSPDASLAWLGFDVDLEALEVSEVVAGGPADLAGLLPGDRLLALDGRDLPDSATYRRLRLALQPNRSVLVRVLREGDELELAVSGLDRINGLVFERAGLALRSVVLNPRSPIQTVEVIGTRPDGPADRLGIGPGDLLNYVQPEGWWRAQRVREPRDLALILSRLGPGARLDVEIWRDKNGNQRLEKGREYSELLTGSLRVD